MKVIIKIDFDLFLRFSISIAIYSITLIFIIIFEMDVKYRLNDIFCTTNQTRLYSYNCFQFTENLTVCTLNNLIITGFMGIKYY